jgi:hypothetical protein
MSRDQGVEVGKVYSPAREAEYRGPSRHYGVAVDMYSST